MTKIGIIGGGQLGRMLALAGYPLGLEFCCMDPQENCSGGQVMPLIQGNYDDEVALKSIAEQCDILTYEFENIPVETVKFLKKYRPTYPGESVLAVAQDRGEEKSTMRRLKIPTVDFHLVNSFEDLKNGIQQLGLPAILKTCRMGYDGKGQWKMESFEQAEELWPTLPKVPMILEAFCPFEREVSLITAASRTGKRAYYPLIENHHEQGILSWSQFPAAQLTKDLQKQAEDYANRLIEDLNYVGVFTIEFFVKEGQLLVNEIAPRVHNSGHLTIEGSVCSQFENHLRAILGWPLGETSARGHNLMLNLIGDFPDKEKLLKVTGLHLHDYGKTPRSKRKLGHLTICFEDEKTLEGKKQTVLELISKNLY